MVTLTGFSKTYGTAFAAHPLLPAAYNVSFSARQGEITGLIGPNGSGKTTILRAIAAIHLPSSGVVSVAGVDTHIDGAAARALVGYAAESAHLFAEFTVQEMLRYIAQITVNAASNIENVSGRIESIAAMLSINDVLSMRVSRLSKGYTQRVSLALALLHDPKVVVLDEPASGLDPAQIHELRRMLLTLAQTKTIVLSTHLMQEAEALCSRIIILQKGAVIAAGTKEELLYATKTDTLEKAYLSFYMDTERPSTTLRDQSRSACAERSRSKDTHAP
jgi:ABC-2 type transport system ATP-binding protein